MRQALQFLTFAFAGSGIIYYLLCIWSALSFIRERRRLLSQKRSHFSPPVSILKAACGLTPSTFQSFYSHCCLEYPEYEIVFGVADAADPVISVINQLIQEFGDHRIKLVICPLMLGMNPKVSNLVQMLRHASHDFLVINDDDISVESSYLRHIIEPLSDTQVGLVTCLYRGVPSKTLGSRFEALGINTDFSAGVLVAGKLEGGVNFGLGSTLACTRRALEATGGLEPLLNHLADDYLLGQRISEAGLKVRLADICVTTFVPAYTIREFFNHQLRWARSTRDSRPWGYFGILLTLGLPWSLIHLLFAPIVISSWYLLVVAFFLRLWMAVITAEFVLNDRTWGDLMLIPARDLTALIIWFVSFASRKITWRGTPYILKNGQLMTLASSDETVLQQESSFASQDP